MQDTAEKKQSYHFLEGGGEMGRLTREFDWSKTSVGSPDTWPQSLRTVISLILLSDFPMFLWWGDNMIQFYNDAYKPSLGNEGKHPKALGQNAVDCWPEIWSIIYPLIKKVKETRTSFFAEDQLIPIYRNGKIEEVYWTFSYSAILGERGEVAGVLVVCHETTKKVRLLKERELTQGKAEVGAENSRNMILQAPVAMCILKGPKHVVEIANARMYELWGKPAEAFSGKPVFDILVDAKYEGFENLLHNVFITGETFKGYNAPVTLFRGDSTQIVYCHFVYEALRDSDGSISGVMVVAIEVTEEAIARQKLEQRESQIRALVESAPFPIGVYVGREMRIEMVNQSIIDVWGKGQNVVGKTYHEVLPEVSKSIYAELDKVYMTGKPFHARNQRVDLVVDGILGTYYFNYSFTPLFDSEGKVYGVMNTAAEVTDLFLTKQKVERSERNFRNMVKQAPVAMCILIGPTHVVEVANDLIVELWGKPEEQVMNKPIFEALPDARGQGLEEAIGNAYFKGESFYANERPVTLLRKGKSEVVYQNFVYEPYRDSDGTILGVLAITIDVTAQVVARQKIEDVVAERTRDLQKTNAELAQFAYIASHDLQEPARKIGTFAEMLKKNIVGRVDSRSEGYLNKIQNSAARMLTLIRDVLAFSQLSKVTQEFTLIDLNDILDNAIADFELYIEEKNAVINSDKLPMIYGIPVQMSQLFSNLISNALKFSGDRTPVVTISLSEITEMEELERKSLDSSRQYFHLSFQDNGIGFSQNNAVQIFDIFQRLHSKEEFQGTGIGLAMCKRICENHNGTIYAESAPGQGATFHVILPKPNH